MHHEYWNSFYTSRESVAVPREPSPFAYWVGDRDAAAGLLVDVGSGNGRDALWFARSGREVLGLDYASAAVAQATSAAKCGKPAGDLRDIRPVRPEPGADGGSPPGRVGPADDVVRALLLHALEDDGRRHLWRLAELALSAGGHLCLEFRTGKDAEAAHVFGEHFRRFLDPDRVVDEIEADGGRVEYRSDGHGMAPFHGEDPHICRLVVGWHG